MRNTAGHISKGEIKTISVDFAKSGWSKKYFALKFAQAANKKYLIINI